MQKWLFLFVLALPLSASEPKELAEAKASYEAAVERAVAPLRDKYVAHLKKLVEQYTKAGKLDEAMKARDELLSYALVGTFKAKDRNNEWEVVFQKGGVARASGTSGTWSVKSGKLVAHFQSGWKFESESVQNESSISGTATWPKNRKETTILTRQAGIR